MQNVSQEAITVESLRLLQETVDYLLRLPAVPVTRELCRKLQAHLDAPETAAVKRETERALLVQNSRYGQKYTPAGLLIVQVEVLPTVATIKLPAQIHEFLHFPRFLKRLDEGLTVDMHPGEVPPLLRR